MANEKDSGAGIEGYIKPEVVDGNETHKIKDERLEEMYKPLSYSADAFRDKSFWDHIGKINKIKMVREDLLRQSDIKILADSLSIHNIFNK